MPVVIKAYTSPTLVLLAFDWAGGANRNDFLGFAIKRVPGFGNQPESWLPNRIDFNGPGARRIGQAVGQGADPEVHVVGRPHRYEGPREDL
jgi:hypothetical protein